MDEQPESNRIAWGDEGARMGVSPRVYALGAVIVKQDLTDVRIALKRLKPASAHKLHWREMSDRQRAVSLESIASFDHDFLVAVYRPANNRKQERARRKCLERLLPALEGRGVRTLVLESRGSYLDKKDIEYLLAMKRAAVAKDIDIEHRAGSSEPLLWIPDQAIGAFCDAECGIQLTHRAADAWCMETERLVKMDAAR